MTKLSKEDSIELVKQMRLKTLNKDAENTLSRGRKILESINAGDYTPNDTVKIPKAEYDALVEALKWSLGCHDVEDWESDINQSANCGKYAWAHTVLRQAIDSAKGK